jgi:hypothetical protein
MPSAVAVHVRISVWGPAGGGACGDMLDAIARIAPRRNGTISLNPSCQVEIPEKVYLDVDSKLFSKVQINSKKKLVSAIPGKG